MNNNNWINVNMNKLQKLLKNVVKLFLISNYYYILNKKNHMMFLLSVLLLDISFINEIVINWLKLTVILFLIFADQRRKVTLLKYTSICDNDEYASYYNYENSESNQGLEREGMTSRRNIVIDSQGRYICQCGKSYKEERYMRHHQRWECGKLPTFRCPHCKYRAKRRNTLKSHIKRRH